MPHVKLNLVWHFNSVPLLCLFYTHQRHIVSECTFVSGRGASGRAGSKEACPGEISVLPSVPEARGGGLCVGEGEWMSWRKEIAHPVPWDGVWGGFSCPGEKTSFSWRRSDSVLDTLVGCRTMFHEQMRNYYFHSRQGHLLRLWQLRWTGLHPRTVSPKGSQFASCCLNWAIVLFIQGRKRATLVKTAGGVPLLLPWETTPWATSLHTKGPPASPCRQPEEGTLSQASSLLLP